MSETDVEEQQFLQAIRNEPDNDGLRLIYADWLADHDASDGNRTDRAELIRLQIEATRLPEGQQQDRLNGRVKELLNKHYREWISFFTSECCCFKVAFDRGMPCIEIELADFLRYADKLFTRKDLFAAKIHCGHNSFLEIAQCPQLANLRYLGLIDSTTGTESIQSLLASPYMPQLIGLELTGVCTSVKANEAELLAASPALQHLTRLSLSGKIGDSGAKAIANSPYLTNLSNLQLMLNGIGNAGAESLASSSSLSKLTKLDLSGNAIGNKGAKSLAASTNLSKLTYLDLRKNLIGWRGQNALKDTTHVVCGRQQQR